MGKTEHSRNQRQMVEGLLRWFASNQRSLPWRNRYTPYATWIAEMMLQQTRTATVIPYYERWMRRFPDVRWLARASEQEVLKLWEGMGYYSRARNIHKTARVLMEQFGGVFPDNYEDIIQLPGIGPYTASAILSIAFNQDYPVVDGNVERVFARLYDLQQPVKAKKSRDFIRSTALSLLPSGRAREFNQALMELGATLCLPRNPLCVECPIEDCCKSKRLGVAHLRPVMAARKPLVPIEVALGVLMEGDRVLIQKRPTEGLMAGLWEFPGGKLEDGETPVEALKREFQEELGLGIEPIRKLTVIRHQYTSYRVTLHCYLCCFQAKSQRIGGDLVSTPRWVTVAELDRYPFPAANRRLIHLLGTLELAK
ncbi:MAG TPA: A/G-specific adenine glycosylase [Syntrophobacteraceae bacterium]|nr:A/G-specific adenine glycosylase [Syntrophobacteraceae bacterium]